MSILGPGELSEQGPWLPPQQTFSWGRRFVSSQTLPWRLYSVILLPYPIHLPSYLSRQDLNSARFSLIPKPHNLGHKAKHYRFSKRLVASGVRVRNELWSPALSHHPLALSRVPRVQGRRVAGGEVRKAPPLKFCLSSCALRTPGTTHNMLGLPFPRRGNGCLGLKKRISRKGKVGKVEAHAPLALGKS